MADFRGERLNSLIQQKISALILDGRIKDPRVSPFLSITQVKTSKDLSFADVYVSNIRSSANIEHGSEGLQSAAGFIQSQLSLSMKIRKIPRLRFHPDTSIRDGFEMIKKLENLVQSDEKNKTSENETGENTV